jgi:hypothetical protein
MIAIMAKLGYLCQGHFSISLLLGLTSVSPMSYLIRREKCGEGIKGDRGEIAFIPTPPP